MSDRFTKFMLTIIAAALCAIAAQNTIPSAGAQNRPCGDFHNPCFVIAINGWKDPGGRTIDPVGVTQGNRN